MATISTNKLNDLLSQWAPGSPVTSEDLAKRGISADLAVHYVKAGWLVRLAHGVYSRPGESLSLHPCLKFLERKIQGLHVGGKTALDWYGVRQYVSQRPVTHLYGWKAGKLPEWFTKTFAGDYHRKRLFKEEPNKLLHAGPFEKQTDAPLVSEPERALLEVLSEKTCPYKLLPKEKLGLRVNKIDNCNNALKFVFDCKVQLELKPSAENLVDGGKLWLRCACAVLLLVRAMLRC